MIKTFMANLKHSSPILNKCLTSGELIARCL